jgi:hypothetical protein
MSHLAKTSDDFQSDIARQAACFVAAALDDQMSPP